MLGEETLPYLVVSASSSCACVVYLGSGVMRAILAAQDGMQVQIQKYDGQPVTVQLPKTVVVEIADCEPTVKNASATETGGKTASTASGLRLKVCTSVAHDVF